MVDGGWGMGGRQASAVAYCVFAPGSSSIPHRTSSISHRPSSLVVPLLQLLRLEDEDAVAVGGEDAALFEPAELLVHTGASYADHLRQFLLRHADGDAHALRSRAAVLAGEI